ncbi:MAG: diaminopimelate decarboxylase [Alphaproteobacteria bacterium]|nr:diaminopimelate decarboxylase [Alphaproteobacteria bacterium]NCQ87838.1 diaminopimelate decarboxylase [Alphaproteobacteria bacterium]NCT05654.1 diaminopimelate decarboxylase [Alphaproteobacteria bacterium]
MSGFTEIKGVLNADNVPLTEIAAAYGTPTYVYSAHVMKTQYEALAGAMKCALPADKQPILCYACKANSNVAVLSYLRSLGASLEIVSEGELHRGLAAGFKASQIVSTGVGKQRREIIACLKAGIHQFNVESLPELEHINNVAGDIGIKATVVFRLNPNVAGGGNTKISTGRKRDKFGINEQTVYKAFDRAAQMDNLDAVGLSVHIGSQVSTVESFKTAFEKMPSIVHNLRDQGHTVSRLDIGGGFPIIYKDEKLLDLDHYAQWVRDIILPLDTQIIMEPGRYLVGNAGVLLTEVLHVKETEETDFLIIDSAMNDLIRPTLYDAYHGIEAVQNRDAAEHSYDVVGPICESGDTFTKGRILTQMKEGDLAVIKSAGAYGFCMASNYNTRPLPAEILVHEGKAHLICPRQDVHEIIARDIIPDLG